MPILRERPWYADGNAQRLTSFGLVLIAVIAIFDSVLIPDLGLGFLYFIPLCIAAAFMSSWQIVVVAAICAMFGGAFSHLQTDPERVSRCLISFGAFVFVAIVIRRIAVVNRSASRHLNDLEQEVSLRHRAQEQLEILINSSPAAVVALSPEGQIVLANKSAHDLLAVEPGGLIGQSIGTYLPPLAQVRGTEPPATIECRAIRANGDPLLVWVALSTFTSAAGSTTAAIFMDKAKAALTAGDA
jgi:two-component system, LuxR family, sensor kinase FixL